MPDRMTATDLTRELVRFDTINPPGQERACVAYLASQLRDAGFDVAFHDLAEDRTNLVARLPGGERRAPLCFSGHVDTVPLGNAPWSHDPHGGEIADGKLWGRGSSDMKSGVAAFVTASLRIARRVRSDAGLVLVITAGEERGCEGAFHLLGLGSALGQAGAFVVAEPTSNRPVVGHKGALWLEARTRGVTAHGSMPEQGVNAVYRAARAVCELAEVRFGVEAHPLLGAPTLNVGRIQGGLNINSVPDECVIGIDIRTVPGQAHREIRDNLAARLGDDVELRSIVDVEGIWTDPEHPWIQEVLGTVADVTGARSQPGGVPYFTDGSALARAYPDAPGLVLGPGEAELAHQTDEFCRVDRIEEAVEIYERLAARWCGA